MKSGFYCDVSPIRRGLERFEKAATDAMKHACKETSGEMQEYAKANAPWRDRTGNARAGLKGSWGMNQYVYYIKLAHSVSYGVYLELSMEKRFEIIAPTMAKYSDRVWEIYKELMGGA